MEKLDEMIKQVLDREDQRIIEQTEELGWFSLGLSQFRGKNGWLVWCITIVQTILFLVGI